MSWKKKTSSCHSDNSYTKTQGMFAMRLAISRQIGLVLKNDVRSDSDNFIDGK